MSECWVALVGPEVEENLSLRYLVAAVHGSSRRCEQYSFNTERDFPRVLHELLTADPAPTVIGLSLAFQWRARDFLALAVALREGGYKGHITVGGHFATFATKEVLEEFEELDSVCRFEAEHTLVALTEALEQGRPLEEVPGLALRRDGVVELTAPRPLPDLTTLPCPDRRGQPARCLGHAVMPLVGSRGCYGNCSFCCIAAWQQSALPGKRYRQREVAAIADEMVAEQNSRGIEIFIFQDDNFFVPNRRMNIERINALADALEERGIRRFATAVKARPADVDPEVFELLVSRLNCLRAYVGIETDSDQGLETLDRRATSAQNRRALEVIRSLDLYICFNLLVFDPDTTIDSLQTNVSFMEQASDNAFALGRVELYAGTPLLARMLAEGRCTGDWMYQGYELASPEMQRVFGMTMACMRDRNFGESSTVLDMWSLRFDLEVARFFHPEVWRPEWIEEGVRLTRSLSMDTVSSLQQIIDRVRSGTPRRGDPAFVAELAASCQTADRQIVEACRQLSGAVCEAVGYTAPSTEVETA